MTEWRPIETAPKDGTPILLYRTPAGVGTWNCVVAARWVSTDPKEWCWFVEGGNVFDDEEFEYAVNRGAVNGSTKHFICWMPLPTPPEKPHD